MISFGALKSMPAFIQVDSLHFIKQLKKTTQLQGLAILKLVKVALPKLNQKLLNLSKNR